VGLGLAMDLSIELVSENKLFKSAFCQCFDITTASLAVKKLNSKQAWRKVSAYSQGENHKKNLLVSFFWEGGKNYRAAAISSLAILVKNFCGVFH